MPGRGEASANPRFVVTSLAAAEIDARTLDEDVYCARGEMENRIKECQLDLFADRTSAATMRANQLRLWFASMAYVLFAALRQVGLAHTELENATSGTIRLKLIKIGAQVTRSVRRIKIAMASACPSAVVFRVAHARLCARAPERPSPPRTATARHRNDPIRAHDADDARRRHGRPEGRAEAARQPKVGPIT